MEKQKSMKQETECRAGAEQKVRGMLCETISLLMSDENERALGAVCSAMRGCVDWLSPMREYDQAALNVFDDACMMLECAVSSLGGGDAEKRASAQCAGLFGSLLERMEQIPDSDMSTNLKAALLYYALYFDEEHQGIERCYALMQTAQENGCYGLRPVMWCNVLMEMAAQCAGEDPARAERYLRRAYAGTYAPARLQGERLQQCRVRAMLADMLSGLCARGKRPAAGLGWKLRAYAAYVPCGAAKVRMLAENTAGDLLETLAGGMRPDVLAFAMTATVLFALVRAVIR